jgi:poly(ADP-ribose) glycohydrolase ARH3
MAIAVALAMRDPVFDRNSFFAELLRQAATNEFADALAQASSLTLDDGVGQLGSSLEAHRSVPTALACFASYPDSYADAVGRAIGLGGDTDTLAAMTGALSGARLGIDSIPRHLLEILEDGPKGRHYLEDLSYGLHEIWRRNNTPS